MEPLMIDVPARIEAPRLILRCPTSADATAQNEAVCESLAALRPYMPWAQAAPTLAQSEAECRRMHARFLLREDLVMFMFERPEPGADGSEGGLVGGTGLHTSTGRNATSRSATGAAPAGRARAMWPRPCRR